MDHEYFGRLAHNGYFPYFDQEPLAIFRSHKEAKTVKGLLPRWQEELLITDKWISQCSSLEREVLCNYRNSLKVHMIQIRMKKLLHFIPFYRTIRLILKQLISFMQRNS